MRNIRAGCDFGASWKCCASLAQKCALTILGTVHQYREDIEQFFDERRCTVLYHLGRLERELSS